MPLVVDRFTGGSIIASILNGKETEGTYKPNSQVRRQLDGICCCRSSSDSYMAETDIGGRSPTGDAFAYISPFYPRLNFYLNSHVVVVAHFAPPKSDGEMRRCRRDWLFVWHLFGLHLCLSVKNHFCFSLHLFHRSISSPAGRLDGAGDADAPNWLLDQNACLNLYIIHQTRAERNFYIKIDGKREKAGPQVLHRQINLVRL